MPEYDVTLIKEDLVEAIRHIIRHCAVCADEGNAKQAASDLGMSTQTVNLLATWWEEFGYREDVGVETPMQFLLDPRLFRAIMESSNPQQAHDAALGEQLTPAQVRARFPTEKWARSPKEPVFKTTILEPELLSTGVFRAFVDLGDVPPKRWPEKATMTIVEKK